MENRRMGLLAALLAAALLGLDQWVKRAVEAGIPLGEARPLIPGFVELRTVHNYGAAWSSFSGMRWMLTFFTAAILLAVAAALAKGLLSHPLGVLACWLVISGGLGNLLDRVRLGYVVDMFNFLFMDYPVFNVADMCIVSGCILGVVYFCRYEKREGPHGAEDASP